MPNNYTSRFSRGEKGKGKLRENQDGKGKKIQEHVEVEVEVEAKPKYLKIVKFHFEDDCCYEEFLRVVRDSVSDGIRFGCRVTYDEPTHILDSLIMGIHVTCDAKEGIVVRIVCPEVYLIGYRSGELKKWFRCYHTVYKWFFPEDTIVLSFGESYGDLGNLLGAKYGYGNFVSAIKGLNSSTNDEERKRHFKVFILMIAEAARFDPIGKHVAFLVRTWKTDEIKGNYKLMINNWTSSCACFIKEAALATEECPALTRSDKDANGIVNTEEVVVTSVYSRGDLDPEENIMDYEHDSDTCTVNRCWVPWVPLPGNEKETKSSKSKRFDNWSKNQIVKLLKGKAKRTKTEK